MKNKPTRHKETNTFKFQPFSERIANVDVDIFHRVGHKYENESEDAETFFHKALVKWSDLNLTESFDAFRKELPATHTLPQLLQQKEEVVAVLCKYIKLGNPLSLQPILELVVALARDLRQDFYAYYSDFVQHLIGLLNTKDSEQLEWTFTCLAYLFKFLWRYLVKDVRIVFTGLLPLLDDSKPEYINNFAAESFAFVARKVKDKKAFLLLVLNTLKKHPESVGGCGRLLFEVMRGVSGQFHSCAEVMMPLLFEILTDDSLPQAILFEALSHMIDAMMKIIHPKKNGLFWTSVFKCIESLVKKDTGKSESVCMLLKLTLQAVTYRSGIFVSDSALVAQHVIELLKQDYLSEDALLLLSEIGATLLTSRIVKLSQEYASLIILKVLALANKKVVLVFIQRILSYPAFEVLVLPQLLRHCQSSYMDDTGDKTVGIGQDFLNLLTVLVLNKAPLCRTGMDLKQWHQYPINFRKVEVPDNNENIPSQFLKELIVNDVDDILQKLETFLCINICLPHITSLDREAATGYLQNVARLVCASLKQASENSFIEVSEGTIRREKRKLETQNNSAVDDNSDRRISNEIGIEEKSKLLKNPAMNVDNSDDSTSCEIDAVENSETSENLVTNDKSRERTSNEIDMEGNTKPQKNPVTDDDEFQKSTSSEMDAEGITETSENPVMCDDKSQGRNISEINVEGKTEISENPVMDDGKSQGRTSSEMDVVEITETSENPVMIDDKSQGRKISEIDVEGKTEISENPVMDDGKSQERTSSEMDVVEITETSENPVMIDDKSQERSSSEINVEGKTEISENPVMEDGKSEERTSIEIIDIEEITETSENGGMTETSEIPVIDDGKSQETTSSEIDVHGKTETLLYILGIVLETLIHLTDNKTLRNVCSLDLILDTLLTYVNDPKYLISLRVLDLYLTAYKLSAEDDCWALLRRLHFVLLDNLSSPFHDVRLLTCHIFSLFEQRRSSSEASIDFPVFGTCLTAELVSPTVYEYRAKVQHLEGLEYSAIQAHLNKCPEFSKVPVQFLLGNLYINFQLLWEPTIKLIATHARAMEITEFWELFRQKLNFATQQIKSPSENDGIIPSLLQCDFLTDLYLSFNQLDDKPDYVNFRLQLWKAMLEFHSICETKNRDISPVFLSFIEEEYYNSNAEMAFSWNIKSKSENTDEEGKDEAMETEETTEDTEIKSSTKELRSARPMQMSAKTLLQTLLAQMTVFSKMKDPKSIYREADLKKVYLDLLTHKNPEVQKAALDCLMAYKYKYLLPYREHMYGLIDDKTFKTELTLFRIDKESEIIEKEHRSELIPLVMRIVYSKMLTKSGPRSGGAGQVRRSLVLRFLAGCHENEMITFLEMAFKIYVNYIQDDPAAMVDSIVSTLNLESVIPPRRLQSSLNLLNIILDKFGRLMGQKLLPYILRVLLCISSIVQGCLAQRGTVHQGYVPILLTLRNSCQDIMGRFFEHMENYDWSEKEVDAVFKVLVWPWLEMLPVEGIHSPTSLLKLFLVWSRNPRYFVLLIKHAEGHVELTPLPFIMKLLLRKQTHPSVTTAIMELVERLLTLQDYERNESEAPSKMPSNLTLLIDKEYYLSKLPECGNLNYGSCMLLPHIPAILERLERKLTSLKNRGLSQRDLVVLSRATELVWDASTSDTLLRLVLPVLGKKTGASEETVSHLITTLDNLFKNVSDPEKHLRALAPLFGEVKLPGPRKLLIELLRTTAKCCNKKRELQLKASADLMCKLNAFDAKWVEQPDFVERLDGFKQVQEMLEKDEIDLDLGSIVIHNCYHFIRTEKDLSLRDSAGYCLRTVAPAICLKYRNSASDLQYLLNDTILSLIRNGIKDKNDAVQYESIKLLGEMARECGDLHPVLNDLSKLANKTDPEVDFFENLLHLQSHRKSRALLKFCHVAKELNKVPNPRTLTHFILPLTSMYLCSDKYAHKHNMVDAAIQAIGVICRLLPWHQYETILRFYLAKLRHQVDYQKQLVRTVVAILDAFHFDLSRAQDSLKERKSKVKTEKMEIDIFTNENIVQGIEAEGKETDIKEVEQTKIKNATDDTEVEESKENKNTCDVTKSPEKLAGDAVLTVEEDEDNEEKEVKPIEEVGPEELAETFENMLDSKNDSIKIDEEEVKGSESVIILAVEKQAVLTKSVATHVIHTITTGLLPQIHRVMAQLTQSEISHKVNKKQTSSEKEEEGILRVPIALAAVKLLQQLPTHMLEQNLSGILMKLCTFLKSRLESIRKLTRETLQKIMLTLGPKYLGTLIHDMSPMLTRGYQVHVLIYTIHSVLVSLKDLFQPGDIDSCLQNILELCKKDLFGDVGEEKEVNQITGKLHEARSTKSFDTFNILAQFVTEKCFVDLLVPLKEVLASTHSFKVIHKCSECLRKIVVGLADNKFVSLESLLIFMYGTASESIPDLMTAQKKQEITPAQKELLARQRPDSFIIPQAPRNRMGSVVTAKTSSKTNAHMLVEFGLQLFHIILKRERLKTGDYRSYVDPLVPILCKCLKAQHIKLTSLALKCLSWVLKMDLPSLRENIRSISTLVFKLLHKYASAGLSKGDNFDMVVAAFKVVAVIVRDVKYYTLNEEQMKALLLYAEQDMHDLNRQATAFTLLKAVLSRKLVAPEMHAVMDKVAKLSITSEHSHIRLQARQVFHQFLMDYPLGKKLDRHVAFYVSQLNYEVQSGRKSALEMISSIITSFPQNYLKSNAGPFYLSLGPQLVNDDSPECRKMIAQCIKIMLERLDKDKRDELFEFTVEWLKDARVAHRRLAAQLCGMFVTVEKTDFLNRLFTLFPIIILQFSTGYNGPGKYVKVAPPVESSENLEKNERLKDHLLFQVLQLLLKICTFCPEVLTDEKWQENVEMVTENCQALLAYPHEWVRLAAAQLLGLIFSSLDVDTVAKAACSGREEFTREECGFFHTDARHKLKTLILDLCAQLQPSEIGAEFIEQVVKNLVFLGRVLKRVSPLGKDNEEEKLSDDEDSESHVKLSLLWMIRRMRKIANVEIIQAPKSTVMRTAVFKWIGAMIVDLGKEGLPPLAHQLLAPLSRELSSTNESDSGKQLQQLAKQVSDLMKKKLGIEVYTRHLSRLQSNLAARRAGRKKVKAMEVLTAPEKAAKRKIKKNLKKKESKKKRIEKIKKGNNFRRKRIEFQVEDV